MPLSAHASSTRASPRCNEYPSRGSYTPSPSPLSVFGLYMYQVRLVDEKVYNGTYLPYSQADQTKPSSPSPHQSSVSLSYNTQLGCPGRPHPMWRICWWWMRTGRGAGRGPLGCKRRQGCWLRLGYRDGKGLMRYRWGEERETYVVGSEVPWIWSAQM